MPDHILPVIVRENPVATGAVDYHEVIDTPINWHHSIDSMIGFDRAEFEIVGDTEYLQEWLFNGVGREVARYDGEQLIWEGQVVSLILSQQGLEYIVDMRDMANKVKIVYAPIDTSANPPTVGSSTTTDWLEDSDSQAKHGIKEFIGNGGTITSTDAAIARQMLLDEKQLPIRSQRTYTGIQRESLKLICHGYGHTLNWRYYDQTTNSGTVNASALIATVVSDLGDFIASTDIATNTLQVQRYYDDNREGLGLLQSITRFGDSSNNRYSLMVMDDRKLTYKQASRVIRYKRRMSDAGIEIYDMQTGETAHNWLLRPDHWMRTLDIYPFVADDPAQTTELEDDLGVFYVKRVEWSEQGDDVTLWPSDSYRFQSLLARAALSGEALL